MVNNESVGSATTNSNGTVSVEHTVSEGGSNTYHWVLEDSYGGRSVTETKQISAPAELRVYNESNSTQLVDNTTLRIRFFGSGGDVIERTVSDGTLNLTGLPVGERFVVTVSDDNEKFYYRRIIVESLYEQSEIYLLPRSVDGAEVEFVLQDYTGGAFAPADTTLFIEAPVTKDFDDDGDTETKYQTIFGDNFGAAGAFPAVLEANERYRLRIINDDGDTRTLGSYTATRDEIERITVKGLTFDPPEGEGYDTTLSLNDTDPENRTLTWKYMDPTDSTTRLDVEVISESGETLYSDTVDTELGNYSIYELELANDTSYTLKWSATRNGEELSVERPIGGGAIGIDIPLESQWLGTFGMLAVVFTLSLSGARKNHVRGHERSHNGRDSDGDESSRDLPATVVAGCAHRGWVTSADHARRLTMTQIQSIKIGATMVAFVLALTTVNTLAAGAGVGIQLQASGVTMTDVQTLNSQLSGPSVTGVGQQDPGFFGIALGIKQTLQQMWALTTRVHLILGSYGVPMVIGGSVQAMIDFTMAIGGLQILGRFKF